jgi:hypothetical protein
MIFGTVITVHVASRVVVLAVAMGSMFVTVVVSLGTTVTHCIPVPLTETSVIVMFRLWNCNRMYVYTLGYGRGL